MWELLLDEEEENEELESEELGGAEELGCSDELEDSEEEDSEELGCSDELEDSEEVGSSEELGESEELKSGMTGECEDELILQIASKHSEFFGCGRISRQDADKFSASTLHIYEYFVSPKWKRGLFLGFDQRSEKKIGKPYGWIRTAKDHHELSQAEFYKHCEIILQPSDTTENWPRVGFEAMASGSVLIVDNRGGWKEMVRHGETGWLCNHARDFIYYASKMAYEPELRKEMAERARIHGRELGGLEASAKSWQEVFRQIDLLPI